MKKSKTTKSSKKSYSSVEEMLEDNNSKIKLTPSDCNIKRIKQDMAINHEVLLNKIQAHRREFVEEIKNIKRVLIFCFVLSIILLFGFSYCMMML